MAERMKESPASERHMVQIFTWLIFVALMDISWHAFAIPSARSTINQSNHKYGVTGDGTLNSGRQNAYILPSLNQP